MKKLATSVMFLIFMVSLFAQSGKISDQSLYKAADSLVLNVGGKNIDFTLPDPGFLEVSNRYATVFNLFVPETNRLLCGFLTKSDVQKITDGKDPLMESYILVEISKEAEHLDCKPKDFKEVLASIGDISKIISSSSEDALKEVNQKLNTMDIQSIQLNDPKSLGVLFSKEDAIASGMIFKVQQGELVRTYMCSMLITRLRERLVFIYLYKTFSGQTTVKEMISLTDKYSVALLTANPNEKQDFVSNFWQGLPTWGRNALIGAGIGLIIALVKGLFSSKKPVAANVPEVTKVPGEDDHSNSQ